jgi:hypothetical protein
MPISERLARPTSIDHGTASRSASERGSTYSTRAPSAMSTCS